MSEIRVDKQVYKIQDFVTWQRHGQLVLSPSFQRRPVWTPTDKSYFLDTVVRGLPTSIIYLRDKRDIGSIESQREVVDGQQRLRTLLAFIEPTLLEDYVETRDAAVIQRKHNGDRALYGRAFPDLPLEVQRAIYDYDFSTHTLPATTDDAQVLQIFARLNSSGSKLEPQELRNAEFSGAFRVVAYQLAAEHLQRWREWKLFNETHIARMREVELTSELLILMRTGIQGKSQPAIEKFYREHDDEYPDGEITEQRFHAVMEAIEDSISNVADTVFSQQAMFYSVFAFLYDLTYGLTSELKPARRKRLPSSLAHSLVEASQILKSESIASALSQSSLASIAGSAGENISDTDKLVARLEKALRGASGDRASRLVRHEFLRLMTS